MEPLIIKKLNKGEHKYKLHENFIYNSKKYGKITVPAGFITDFATIPALMQGPFNPVGERYDYAAVVHDWLYATHFCSKTVADWVMWECMIAYKVGRSKSDLIWQAVHSFGDDGYMLRSSKEVNHWRKLFYDKIPVEDFLFLKKMNIILYNKMCNQKQKEKLELERKLRNIII